MTGSASVGVFETLLEQGGWSDFVNVDSCGVGDWHVGGADGFTQVLDLVELASRGLLREICDAHFAQ